MRLLELQQWLLFSLSTYFSIATSVQHERPLPEGFVMSWADARLKAEAFTTELNTTEKAFVVTGSSTFISGCIGTIAPIPRLNFSGLCLQDGPSGMNRADLVSVFPAGLVTAATWDRNLIRARGRAIGNEFRAKGAHVVLGPSTGPLGRHALGGRNWEGFGPDPYLSGVAMRETITGIQSQSVQAVAKHLIGNEQELARTRMPAPDGTFVEALSANIDERTLHELYLWPFIDAVEAGCAAVMCAYNRVNMTYACENPYILNDILKQELNFKGYVVSDFFATYSGLPSVRAGLDMNMPGAVNVTAIRDGESYWGSHLVQAIDAGELEENSLNEMVTRVLTPYFALGQDRDFPSVDPSLIHVLATQYGLSFGQQVTARNVRGNHSSIIREIAAAGTVLVKNEQSLLPLKKPKNIGVFGNDACDPTSGLLFSGFTDALQGPEFGTLDIGGGSGTVRHTSVLSPIRAIKERAEKDGSRVQYLFDNTIIAKNDFSSIYPIPDVCLVFIKTWASEGVDRLNFEHDWNSTLVVENVASICPETIVVSHSAGINTLPFATNPNVTAIIIANYPGEQSGASLVDVLYGDVNPSGKLPYTIPANSNDCNIPIVNITGEDQYDSNAWQTDYTEGQLIDYRCFDAQDLAPLYEFGFGLSYTKFKMLGSMKINVMNNIPTLAGNDTGIWEEVVQITTQVSNIGNMTGATVLQLYLSMPTIPDHRETPLKVLRGFEKFELGPGNTSSVTFKLNRRDLSWWNTSSHSWQIPVGEFELQLGFSSRDIQQTGRFEFYPHQTLTSNSGSRSIDYDHE